MFGVMFWFNIIVLVIGVICVFGAGGLTNLTKQGSAALLFIGVCFVVLGTDGLLSSRNDYYEETFPIIKTEKYKIILIEDYKEKILELEGEKIDE